MLAKIEYIYELFFTIDVETFRNFVLVFILVFDIHQMVDGIQESGRGKHV